MYKVLVMADESGIYVGNGLKFETSTEATKYAKDLFARWTAVRFWAVVPASAPGRLTQAEVDRLAVRHG